MGSIISERERTAHTPSMPVTPERYDRPLMTISALGPDVTLISWSAQLAATKAGAPSATLVGAAQELMGSIGAGVAGMAATDTATEQSREG